VQRSGSEGLTSEESTLVQKAVERDAHAFGQLYDMYVDRVYRHVYYRVSNGADAEDLTQQVFMKAWQAIGGFRITASPFVAWLLAISHNVVVNFYRTKTGRVYIEADILAADSPSSPDFAAEMSLDQQRLRRAILQLRDEEQQVLVLRFMEGFAFAEIASLLKKKEGTIRVILHRALTKLRGILEKEAD